MSTIIGGIFATIVLSAVGLVFFTLNMEANVSWNRALNEKFVRMQDQLGTQLTINSAMISNQGAFATVTIENVGIKPIEHFEGMDILVSYTDTNDESVQDRLRYNPYSALSTYQWNVTSIKPDVFQPGILDPHETAILKLMFGHTIKSGSSGILHLVTNNGTKRSFVFPHQTNP